MVVKSVCYAGKYGLDADAARQRSFLRLRGLTVAACCGAVIALAGRLTPDTAGTGTHRQLGLPACSFLVQTGYPCPTCGMTTSVSAMAHGRFIPAFQSHPFGVAVFAGLVVLAAAAVIEVLTGQNTLPRLGKCAASLAGPAWWIWMFIIGIPTGWALKLIWGIANGTLPV